MSIIIKISFNIFLFLLLIIKCNGQVSSVYGVWKISKCISDDYYEPVLSKEERLREMGQRLVITPERLIISFKRYSDTCLNPALEMKSVKTNDYYSDDKQLIPWLGFTQNQTVFLVKTGCESYWFKQFFYPREKTLIMRAEGFYYYLKQEVSFSDNKYEKSIKVKKDIFFVNNQTYFKNEREAFDTLKYIANMLKNNKSLFVVLSGNVNAKATDNFNSSTTINGKDGTFKDLLLSRADVTANILISQFGVNPSQVFSKVGSLTYKSTTTLEVLVSQ